MTYAALSHGVPVLGIVGNNDQLLNMAHIENRGAGLYLRFWNLTEKEILVKVNRLLQEQKFKKNAHEIQNNFSEIRMKDKLKQSISENCP